MLLGVGAHVVVTAVGEAVLKRALRASAAAELRYASCDRYYPIQFDVHAEPAQDVTDEKIWTCVALNTSRHALASTRTWFQFGPDSDYLTHGSLSASRGNVEVRAEYLRIRVLDRGKSIAYDWTSWVPGGEVEGSVWSGAVRWSIKSLPPSCSAILQFRARTYIYCGA